MVGGNPQHDAYGFRHWKNPVCLSRPGLYKNLLSQGAFLPYVDTGSLGRFEGFLAAMFQAAFVVAGPDYVSMVAGEAKNPSRTLKTSFKTANVRSMPRTKIITACKKTFVAKSKLINVTGLPGTDSLISIYNQDGIKAAGLFDNKPAYTYELAIDLKQLGLPINDVAKFAYHINLGSDISKNLMGMMNLEVGADGKISHDGGNPAMALTDFWGEYTLAKK